GVLEAWKEFVGKNHPTDRGTSKPKLAIVAVSGGALRSAYWASVVLERISQEIPGFGEHVRIITGASGGMLGGAYFVKWQRDLRERFLSAKPEKPTKAIPCNSLQTLARHIALREVVRAVLPRSVIDLLRTRLRWAENDRGIELENDWRKIQFPFAQLR